MLTSPFLNSKCVGLASQLDVRAFLALLLRVLLKHARPNLACHHAVLAVAFALTFGRLDDVLVTGYLHERAGVQSILRAQS